MTRDIAPARRICPACARREEGILDDNCLVCAGTGTLELGRAALSRFTPQTVSKAVEIAIEAQARTSIAVPHPDLEACRQDIATIVARLREGRLLDPNQPLPDPGPRLPPGQQWATTDHRPYGMGDHGFSAATYLTQLVPAAPPPPRAEGAPLFTITLDPPRQQTSKGRRRRARRRR